MSIFNRRNCNISSNITINIFSTSSWFRSTSFTTNSITSNSASPTSTIFNNRLHHIFNLWSCFSRNNLSNFFCINICNSTSIRISNRFYNSWFHQNTIISNCRNCSNHLQRSNTKTLPKWISCSFNRYNSRLFFKNRTSLSRQIYTSCIKESKRFIVFI